MSVVASLSTVSAAPPAAVERASAGVPWLRAALIGGCIAAAAWAAWVGSPQPFLRADAELAHLLRGMAAIKAAMVLAGVGVLFWRFGRPASPGIAVAYLAGVWAAAGASMLIWQLTSIPLAAFVFHAGAFALLGAAWRDGRTSTRTRWSTPLGSPRRTNLTGEPSASCLRAEMPLADVAPAQFVDHR